MQVGCHNSVTMSSGTSYADVVIVAYNSADTIRSCVEPLLADPGLNIVIVDNASEDDPAEVVADLDVTVVQSTENLGFGAGCNLGWRHGTSPHVVFLNPDARIEASAVRQLVAALDAPDVGLAAPKILNEDSTVQQSQHRFPTHATTWTQALLLHRLVPRADWAQEDVVEPGAYERASEPDWVGGACIALRRETLERLEGFDERFFMYCEDMDLCRRLRDLALRVRFVPAATASHEGGRSAPAPRRNELKQKSRIVYARKHSNRAGYADFVASLTCGLCVRVLLDFRQRSVHAYGLMGVARGVLITLPYLITGGS